MRRELVQGGITIGKQQKEFLAFVKKVIAVENEIENVRARKKYIELFGEVKNAKQWENFTRRSKRKLNLKTVTVKQNNMTKYFWRKK